MSFPKSPPRQAARSCTLVRSLLLASAALSASGCLSSGTTRVTVPSRMLERAAPDWSAPPPAPQVMVAEPVGSPPSGATSDAPRADLPPVESSASATTSSATSSTIAPATPPSDAANLAAPSSDGRRSAAAMLTEEQRNDAFRAYVGAPRTYAPAPLPPPRVVDRIAERVVYHDVRPVHYVPSYSVHRYGGYEPVGSTLARTALYTGLGAIIGHQYHHRGRGAAIGAGLALLTSPWRWYDDCDSRWSYRGSYGYCWDD
ncbi:MAG: hypothetical protein JNL90_02535 [Planctomycetes bacterium]|nr:hypothetical protein [Planctomycetota bacterium]